MSIMFELVTYPVTITIRPHTSTGVLKQKMFILAATVTLISITTNELT